MHSSVLQGVLIPFSGTALSSVSALSGAVEPVGAALTILAAGFVVPLPAEFTVMMALDGSAEFCCIPTGGIDWYCRASVKKTKHIEREQ